MRMPFGKYEKWEVDRVPIDYHVWLWTYVPIGDLDFREAVRQQIVSAGMQQQIPATAVNGSVRLQSHPRPKPAPEPPPHTHTQAPPHEKKHREESHEGKREEVLYRWANGVPPEHREMILTIVEKGYRQLALQKHPDRGGSLEDFHRLQEAMGWLRKQLK